MFLSQGIYASQSLGFCHMMPELLPRHLQTSVSRAWNFCYGTSRLLSHEPGTSVTAPLDFCLTSLELLSRHLQTSASRACFSCHAIHMPGVYRKKVKKKFQNQEVLIVGLLILRENKDLNQQKFCPDPEIQKKRGLDKISLSLEKKSLYQRPKYSK